MVFQMFPSPQDPQHVSHFYQIPKANNPCRGASRRSDFV